MEGNDGELYQSVPDKRGVHSWKRETRKVKVNGRSYEIHDNGGRPYTVVDQSKKKTAMVYADNKLLKTLKYSKLWTGNPKSQQFGDWEPGNTVLVQLGKTRCVYVGRDMLSFNLLKGDIAVDYYSPIGNNDVPYPYLIGKTHTYLINEAVTVPNAALDFTKDVYSQYYGHNGFSEGVVKDQSKKFKLRNLP